MFLPFQLISNTQNLIFQLLILSFQTFNLLFQKQLLVIIVIIIVGTFISQLYFKWMNLVFMTFYFSLMHHFSWITLTHTSNQLLFLMSIKLTLNFLQLINKNLIVLIRFLIFLYFFQITDLFLMFQNNLTNFFIKLTFKFQLNFIFSVFYNITNLFFMPLNFTQMITFQILNLCMYLSAICTKQKQLRTEFIYISGMLFLYSLYTLM